jgi:hypothetical protein
MQVMQEDPDYSEVLRLFEEYGDMFVPNGSPHSTQSAIAHALVGSCLFPFVAHPMIAEALGLGPKELRDFMKRRRVELPALLKRTL